MKLALPVSVTLACAFFALLNSTVQAQTEVIGAGRYRFSGLAGAPGSTGYVDAIGASARFDYPGGMAVDSARNVYVSERYQCTIRKITADGVVTTFAGAAGQAGSQDGTTSVARFNHPTDLALDAAGNQCNAPQSSRGNQPAASSGSD
jgi:hypothetical protein